MSEHDAFAKLTQSLSHAAEAATNLGLYRPDQDWNKIAELLETMKDNVYKLALSRIEQ